MNKFSKAIRSVNTKNVDAQIIVLHEDIAGAVCGVESWTDELRMIAGTQQLVALWQQCLGKWNGKETQDWLDLAGGMHLSNATNVLELLVLADRAPNEMLFGLAYGKISDVLAAASQGAQQAALRDVRWDQSNHGPVFQDFCKRVLDRGYSLRNDAEEVNLDYFEDMYFTCAVMGDANDDMIVKASQSPDFFMLGQLTSWILTGSRMEELHLQGETAVNRKVA